MFVLYKDGDRLTELRSSTHKEAVAEMLMWAEAKMFQLSRQTGSEVYVSLDGNTYLVRSDSEIYHRYRVEEV